MARKIFCLKILLGPSPWGLNEEINYCDSEYYLRWVLDSRAVDRTGVGYTKNSDVIQFELSDKVYSTRKVTWQIKFNHSAATEDSTLHCEAQYNYSAGLSC